MDDILMRWVIKENPLNNDVDLCHFADSANDEEKVKLALQYLSKNEEPIYIHQEFKSVQKATEYIDRGNKIVQSASWQCLLEIYTEAIIYAPPDSGALARAYGSRSAALCDGGLYEDCMLDIERALNIGYPDDMKAKLYARKVKCLLALHKEISPEVEQAAADARQWTEEMNDGNKRYMLDILNRLHLNSSLVEPSRKIDNSQYLPRTPDDNPKIKGASSAIEIKYSEKFGRHIVATRDIKAGETLLVHKAYASIVHRSLFHKSCWNCSKLVSAGVPCHQCVSVIYCNEACRDMAWQEYHDIECPVITPMLNAQVISSEILCLRLVIKAYKEAGTFEKLKEDLLKIDAIKDPIARGFSDNMFDHTKYASVYTIFRPKVDASYNSVLALQSATILYFLAATTEMFEKKIDNFEDLLNQKWTLLIGGLIMRHTVIFGINHPTVRDADRVGVNPLLTLWNHSCDLMTTQYNSGDINVVVAIQMIKKGEQIFTNYDTNFHHQPKHERQNYLMKLSNFLCECVACRGNWGPQSHFSFRSALIKQWPESIEILSNYIGQKYPSTTMYMTAESMDKQLIIENIADMINFIFHIRDEYPTKEIMNLKALLHNLYASISD